MTHVWCLKLDSSSQSYYDVIYTVIKVLFDEKVNLKKNTRYSLFAEISGPDSLCGRDGVSSVKCGDVTFTFSEFFLSFFGRRIS